MTSSAALKKHWWRMVPLWLLPIPFVVYTFMDPQLQFKDPAKALWCAGVFGVLFFGALFAGIKVMKQNDHPFLEKSFLLIGLPFGGVAFLTYLVCVMIFGKVY